jgi:hypothetical protein
MKHELAKKKPFVYEPDADGPQVAPEITIRYLKAMCDHYRKAAEAAVTEAGPVDADDLDKGVIISLASFDALKELVYPEEKGE